MANWHSGLECTVERLNWACDAKHMQKRLIASAEPGHSKLKVTRHIMCDGKHANVLPSCVNMGAHALKLPNALATWGHV